MAAMEIMILGSSTWKNNIYKEEIILFYSRRFDDIMYLAKVGI